MPDDNINKNKKVEAEPEATKEQPVEEKTYDQIIEDGRKDLFKSYSVSRRISTILMFVMLAGICGAMFLFIYGFQIACYILIGVLLAGMITFYIVNRKRFPEKTKNYVALVSETANKELFKNQGFAEIKTDPEEKLKMDDLVGDGIYSDANGINSRNVVHGVFNGHHFLYAEAALTRPSTKKQQVPPLFVGRYISVPNNLKFDGRFIITMKNPKQPLDLPNAVSDLVLLEDKDDFTVYGLEGSNYHDAINNKVVSQLRRIEINGHLLNVNVVFWAGHTAVYLSYDDAIMSVPFEKPFDKEGFEKALNDLFIAFNAITEE